MKIRIKSFLWAFSLAWKINKLMIIIWFLIVSLVSVLPSLALYYNREIINEVNKYITTGIGTYDDVFLSVFLFGITTALVGISNRINVEFIYSVMYNKYYFGMAELLMDSVQNTSMEELLNKNVNDEYYSVILREGSLTDVISGFCSLLGKFINLLSLLIVSISVSLPVFVLSIIYTIISFYISFKYTQKNRYSINCIRSDERLADYYSKIPYSKEFAKELRLFNTKRLLIKNWENAYKPIENYKLKDCFQKATNNFLTCMGFYVFLGVISIISVFSVAKKDMTAADLIVMFTMCISINTSISEAARMIIVTDHGLYAVERQYRIFSNASKFTNENKANITTKQNKPLFQVTNLSYEYPGNKLAIDNISFSINQGETVALLGTNGSGKSTLIKLLLQLYQPTKGEICFQGINYNKLPEDFLKNKIGIFFQDYYLFHMPIWENIGFGNINNIKDDFMIDEALRKGRAYDIVARLPYGKETFVYKTIEKTGAEFSGGEKQKLAIARTYMSEKDILIFDEPASALDPISELEQFMNIKEKAQGKTAILISHRVGFAQLADKIILLDHGKIVDIGNHNELMKKSNMYAELFKSQARWYKKTEV